MRPMWSGFISFGLINIPVKLYTATEDNSPKFHLFHSEDLSPIKYSRVCTQDGKDVPWEEVVKGYEYKEGEYVILTEDDFKKAMIEHEKTIDILNFVDEQEIDPIYFEKPYFLEPGKGGAKPYALLREAIRNSQKVGVGKFILHNKEHYAVLKTLDDLIILNQIRTDEDLRSSKGLNIPESKISKQEIDMALMLIDSLTGKFEPNLYQDSYVVKLMEIIEQKAKGKKGPKTHKAKEIRSTKVVDLMSQLKKSLEKGTPSKKTKSRKKRAA